MRLLQLLWGWAVPACMLENFDHLLQNDLLLIRVLLSLAILVLLWNIVNAPDGSWAICHCLSTLHAQKKSAVTPARSVSIGVWVRWILLIKVPRPASDHHPQKEPTAVWTDLMLLEYDAVTILRDLVACAAVAQLFAVRTSLQTAGQEKACGAVVRKVE
jgi:hypothetical protein